MQKSFKVGEGVTRVAVKARRPNEFGSPSCRLSFTYSIVLGPRVQLPHSPSTHAPAVREMEVQVTKSIPNNGRPTTTHYDLPKKNFFLLSGTQYHFLWSPPFQQQTHESILRIHIPSTPPHFFLHSPPFLQSNVSILSASIYIPFPPSP